MSTEWFLLCLDCGAQNPDSGVNHGEEDLASVLAARDSFEAALDLLPAGTEVNVEINGRTTEVGRFFRAHKGHRMVVRNEYGDDSNACAKYTDCPHCGSSDRCGLAKDHPGRCEPKRIVRRNSR